MREWMRSIVLGAWLVAAAIAIVACGSSGASSTTPSFCSSLTTLKTSVKALPTTNVIKNGTNALKTATDTVVKNAHQVVDSAKHEFPNETAAVTSSVNALQATVKDIERNASPALAAQAIGNAVAVTLAVKNFASSASPKCG